MFCNHCGQKLDEIDACNLGELRIHFYYGSKRDGDTMKISLCSRCYDELADRFIDECMIDPVFVEEPVRIGALAL